MKFAFMVTLASATIVLAQEVVHDLSVEAGPTTTWLSEAELNALENGKTLETPSPLAHINIASTQCAAHPRGVARRSLESRVINPWTNQTLPHTPTSQVCGSTLGCVTNPGPRTIIQHITQQRCANSCVCRGDINGCKAFAWSANGIGYERGLCILYTKTLADMHYRDGVCDKYHPSRLFYSRACYHKGAPYLPSAVQTTMTAKATPPPYMKRETGLHDALRIALSGLK